MASAALGSEVRQGYSSMRRWKKSSRRLVSVRNHEWDWLWVLGPRPWLVRKGQKLVAKGWWVSEQLVRMSRLKREGSWRMWIQRLVQSESRSDCWMVVVRKKKRRRRKTVVCGGSGGVGGGILGEPTAG
ncbi:hypothetical protein Hanom_Chr02g00152201 [Helianthus anomalus]